MKISVTLTAENEADVAKLATVATQFGGDGFAVAGAPAKAPKAEKVKKAEAAEAPAEEKPAKTEKAEKPAKAKKSDGPDLKAVREVFGRLIDTLGEDEGPAAGKKLLKKFGAKQIPDLAAEHYQAVIDEAESLIKEAKNTESDDDDDDLDLDDDDADDSDDE